MYRFCDENFHHVRWGRLGDGRAVRQVGRGDPAGGLEVKEHFQREGYLPYNASEFRPVVYGREFLIMRRYSFGSQ